MPHQGDGNSEEFETFIDRRVGERVKLRRILLGFTRHDLGKAVDVSVQQIHKYETATNRISCSKLYNLARFLRVPVNYFFEMLDSQKSSYDVSSVAEDDAEFVRGDEATERELLRMMQIYKRVKSPIARKKIVDLVEVISVQFPEQE